MGVTLTGVAVASLALRHGRLVITLRRPVMHVSAVIHPQALKESRQLRTAARRHRVRRLRLTVLTTDAHGRQATVAQLVRVAS